MSPQEQAEHDRLGAENTYLLSRLVETQAQLAGSIDRFNVAIEQLNKIVTPVTLPQMLTVEEVAKLLRTGESTIYGWIRERKIPYHETVGGKLFDRQEILEWTKRHRDDDTGPLRIVGLPRSKRLRPGKGAA